MPISIPPLPNGTPNLQDTEARNTGLSSTTELAARHNVHSTRGRGRPRADLSRCSTRVTNSQYQDLRLRAQRPGRRERPRWRPPRRPVNTVPPFHGKSHLTSTLSHQLHRILIVMRPPRSLHPMLTKSARSLTHTHYGLRRNSVPRDWSETCGFRDCTCVMALNKSPTIPTGPPKTPVDSKPQFLINSSRLLVSRVVIRAEKTYTGLEREQSFPVDVILE